MSPFLFWRSLVGSLRALTSAEMAALMCIAAARTGFLLAALHSVAKRVSRGQAYHPRWSRPRLPEDRPARLRPRNAPQPRPLLLANQECPHFHARYHGGFNARASASRHCRRLAGPPQ